MSTESMIEKLYPGIRCQTRDFLKEAEKLTAFLFCGYRSFEEQTKLYNQGRTTPGSIVTNAKAGSSYHNYGLAIDVVFKNNGNWTWDSKMWKQLGKLGEQYGFEWGGSWTMFPDRPHFQITLKQDLVILRNIYVQHQNIDDVWDYLFRQHHK
jgi:peptidoglycan L-alanyl-D-glutamate endopeptidase CwlK